MNDLTSKIYFLYGNYYLDLGNVQSQNQLEYLKGSAKMYDKAMEIVIKITKNSYLREKINNKKSILTAYCSSNGLNI